MQLELFDEYGDRGQSDNEFNDDVYAHREVFAFRRKSDGRYLSGTSDGISDDLQVIIRHLIDGKLLTMTRFDLECLFKKTGRSYAWLLEDPDVEIVNLKVSVIGTVRSRDGLAREFNLTAINREATLGESGCS